MTVSIQGYLGSFHHIAATHLWGHDVNVLERATFTDVFDDVTHGRSPVGLVAVENTITGSIPETLDLLLTQPVHVIGEIILHINQNLIVIPGTKHPTLKTVFSHPVALQQCLDFFKQRVPQATLIASDDTGGSVKDMMAKGDATRASVASSLAAKLYGAEVLDAAIQSDKQNFTRFFVIVPVESDIASVVSALVATAQDQWQTPANKTTLILQVKHQPGELARCLKIIADFETNLTRIESRPIRGRPWEYTIQLDMILTQPAILTQMMRNLDAHVIKSKTLGLYGPASVYES